MKIGVENCRFRTVYDERTSLKLIAEAGFDCVDYSLFSPSGNTPDWLLADDYLQKAEETRKMLAEFNLESYQSHAPFRLLSDAPRDESNPDYLGIIRALEYSGKIGTKCVVVHALTPPRGGDVVQFNVPFYMSLVPTARKAGVKIAIENLFKHDEKLPHLMPRLYLPSQLTALLDQLPQDCFTVCLDTGHTAICGIEPDEFVRNMPKGVITALHVHDNNRLRDMHLLPYLCDLDWESFLTELKKYEYQGVFNLELCHFFGHMPKELYPTALKLAVETGRAMSADL